MDTIFWYKLALSFIVGSGWVALSTIAAERYGSKVGGLIGGLPSTVFVSLLFIGITQTPRVASETTTLMPVTQGINGIFVVVYLLLVRRGLVTGLLSALGIWFLLAGSIAAIGIQHLWVSLCGWALCFLGSYLVAERVMTIPGRGEVHVRCTLSQAGMRALFGGSVIAFAVWAGKLLGPAYGGILATFPAMFFSTLAITYRRGGPEFSQAVGKAMMMSGMINVALYAIAVRYLYIWFGLIQGTALALTFACGAGYLTYLFMGTRLASPPQESPPAPCPSPKRTPTGGPP
jgi:uncharacterized protein DUF3147